ncbi:MAG: hypothetical protein QOF74_7237 [Caballeronia mineralivorans]|jgi:hypothetical protein|nr:hypothetical protein [Caballeronia mineralivorans]
MVRRPDRDLERRHKAHAVVADNTALHLRGRWFGKRKVGWNRSGGRQVERRAPAAKRFDNE